MCIPLLAHICVVSQLTRMTYYVLESFIMLYLVRRETKCAEAACNHERWPSLNTLLEVRKVLEAQAQSKESLRFKG